ncbi:MAG: hypothetical protein IJU95_07620 [Treponema sp.]|nr:hypothetical protein [Treponema sp.]
MPAQASFFDNYVYQQWSSFGGLTGTTATDILQTHDGFINIGTYEGLVRFDGVAFSTMRRSKDNGLTFASVRVVMEDKSGNMWIGSNDEGIQLLQKEGNMSFTTLNGLPNNSIRAIVEDNEKNVWVGTAGGVVCMTKSKHLLNPQFEAGTVSKGVISTQLICDNEGRVWLTTENDKGLFVFKDGLFRTIASMDKFGDYTVTAVCQDLKGKFWVGTDNSGLIKIENGQAEQVHTGTMLDSTPVSAIYPDKNGAIWFGTESGLAVYSNGKFYECNKEGLQKAKINKIISDREGNIWVATDRNGIGKLTYCRFKMFRTGTTSNAIAEDLDGRVWVGTDNGVMCYIGGQQVTNALTKFTQDIRVRHVDVTENGDILVSCYRKPGQLRYNTLTGKITSWSSDEGLAGNKVRVAIEGGEGELYVGTTTGLSIIHKDGTIINFKQLDGLENEYVMCLYLDANGMLWIGTDGGGVYLMRNEKLIGRITTENGLAGNVVFKISQDEKGSYWICSGSGLTRCPAYDSSLERIPVLFDVIRAEQGLGTDSVFQMLPDKLGNIWMTSNYGVSSVSFEDLMEVAAGRREVLVPKFYNKNDGLDSDGPTSTAVSACDSDGRLWFPMVDGVAVYNPAKDQASQIKPLVCIESIRVDTVEHKEFDSVVELKPGTKRVDIKYTGLSFDAPERIMFTHQLTGFDDDFSIPNTSRTVSYTNLKPGKHTFMVSAINGDGVISDKAETMLFLQKPYIWQTTWFWIVVSVASLIAVFSVIYLRERRMARENIRLEGLVQERTKELAVEKEKSDQLLRAILPDKIARELKDDIHAIGENFADVTMLFSDIVSFTKTSSNHTASEIVLALNDLFSRFDERAKRMGVEKIKTIGDAYMAGCGLPSLNDDHARIMVEFAKGMYEDLKDYNENAKIKFNIRIGLNRGPVSAGVIGKTKFVYDVWGNTVNVASRMESACSPGGIRVSQAVYDRLKDSDIKFSEPIECDIKGKGLMTTYDVIMGED